RRRGGWCYEMNGTLGLALKLAGFEVTRHAGDGTAPATHLVLTVALEEGTFACDVGFGDGPIEPYALVEGAFSQAGFEFKLETEADGRRRFSNHRFGAAPGFSIGPPDEAAMWAACRELQTSPDSPFVQHATLFRREGEAVVSLIDRTLRLVRPEGVTQQVVADAAAYVATLKARFGLDAPDAAALWPALCERHEAYLAAAAARKAAAAVG
ncbi:MAG: arylamine N-acetyltransferase family protein, partial [Caulobacteraceae bacterium]